MTAIKLKDAKKGAVPFIKKNVKHKDRPKEMWLKTPHYMQCMNVDGSVMKDDEGDALAIPLLTKVVTTAAVKLIRKYQAQIDIDDEGDMETILAYSKASIEEIEAYEAQMQIRRDIRAKLIKDRKLRDAKTISVVSASDVNRATGLQSSSEKALQDQMEEMKAQMQAMREELAGNTNEVEPDEEATDTETGIQPDGDEVHTPEKVDVSELSYDKLKEYAQGLGMEYPHNISKVNLLQAVEMQLKVKNAPVTTEKVTL